MMLIVVLVGIVCATDAQYPADSLQQYPPQLGPSYGGASNAPVPYGIPRSNPYNPFVYDPLWIPEYPDSEETLYPRRRYSDSSSSGNGNDCNNCRRVALSCRNSPGSLCSKPKIKHLKGQCKEAVVSCDSYGENMVLVTNSGDILSEGLGISKLIKCNGRRWTARDIHGDRVRFRGLRCFQQTPDYNYQNMLSNFA